MLNFGIDPDRITTLEILDAFKSLGVAGIEVHALVGVRALESLHYGSEQLDAGTSNDHLSHMLGSE